MLAGGLQVGVAAVGSVEITAFPKPSTATHNDVEAHETPERKFASMLAGGLQVGVAAVGSVEITAFPTLSTATHNDVEGHETPTKEHDETAGRPRNQQRFGQWTRSRLNDLPIDQACGASAR
jgi:hypothetical protein